MEEQDPTAETSPYSQFTSARYLSIESYRKNGEAVRTPVWFVENQGTIYVRTGRTTGKVKRIRHNPSIRIAPCSFSGKPRGSWVEAKAGLATKEETEQTLNLLRQKYGLSYTLTTILHRLQGKADRYHILAIKV